MKGKGGVARFRLKEACSKAAIWRTGTSYKAKPVGESATHDKVQWSIRYGKWCRCVATVHAPYPGRSVWHALTPIRLTPVGDSGFKALANACAVREFALRIDSKSNRMVKAPIKVTWLVNQAEVSKGHSSQIPDVIVRTGWRPEHRSHGGALSRS